MVKANTSNIDSWQHLYRALLRSSAASVRFCRPAARNTRRYLRDEFARALVADKQHGARPSSTRHGTLSNINGETSIATNTGSKSIAPSSAELLHQQTHNTLAFHLSASLLRSSTVDRRPSHTPSSNTADCSAFNNAELSSTSDPRGGSREPPGHASRLHKHVDAHPPTQTIATQSTELDRGKQPTKTARLAHRVISNLSSLTYHHLSPHTQMQSRAHRKQNRARKPQKLSSLARVLGKMEADLSAEPGQTGVGLENVLSSSTSGGGGVRGGGDETLLNALHMKLGFLMPSVKPARGPVSARLKEWDGQDADKIASAGSLRQIESDLKIVERLLQQHDAAKAKQVAKQVQQLKNEAEQLKRKIKSASKALAQVEARDQLENIAVEHLADLVAAAQDSEQILLGKNR